jgi:hypothetical protein
VGATSRANVYSKSLNTTTISGAAAPSTTNRELIAALRLVVNLPIY